MGGSSGTNEGDSVKRGYFFLEKGLTKYIKEVLFPKSQI